MVGQLGPIPLIPAELDEDFHANRRLRGHRSPTYDLNGTHSFGILAASIDTGAVFATIPVPAPLTAVPTREQPITFGTKIEITGASPTGLILEFGDSTTGVKLGLSGTAIEIAAGAAAGLGGVDGTVTVPALGVVGARLEITLSIDPAQGEARLFVNNDIAIRASQSPAQAFTGNLWASGAAGSVGAAQQGTSTQRTPTAINGAPVNFTLVEAMRAYTNQIPKWFD